MYDVKQDVNVYTVSIWVPTLGWHSALNRRGVSGDELRAAADCFLSQVYAYAGRHQEGIEAGMRALAVFEARGNVWWTCRALTGAGSGSVASRRSAGAAR